MVVVVVVVVDVEVVVVMISGQHCGLVILYHGFMGLGFCVQQ